MHPKTSRTARAVSAPRLLSLLLALIAAASASTAQVLAPSEEPERQQEIYTETLREAQASEELHKAGEDPRGRSFWFEYQRRYPFDVVPAGAHKTAIQQMHAVRDRMHAASEKGGSKLFAANQWQGIGPTNVGGRVRAMVVHPDDPETVYLGGASGGVWKTTDGGATWRTTFDKQTALTIGAMAIDRSNPNTLYVGTGEMRVASDIGFMADGIFKTTDGGETWRNIGLNNLSAVSGLHVHASNPSIVYVTSGRNYLHGRYAGNGLGSGRGFYRSTDGGTTWSQIMDGVVQEIAVNPLDNDELLISTPTSILRSTNAGASFTAVNTGLQNITPQLGIRISLAYDPVTPTTVYALQAYRTAQLHQPMLYRSTNSGQSWTSVPTLVANFFRTQGDYNNCIAVDPNNPDNILAGGIDLWRSTNGGSSWENVTNTRGSTFNSEVSHPDQHIITFDRNIPGVVYVGSDGGVYQSFNSGATWRRLHSALPITQFHAIEVDQTRPYRLYGGTQDNQTQGGFGSETAYTDSWRTMLGGDGFWVVVDRTNPDIVYAESQYGEMRRINTTNLAANPVNIITALSSDGGAWSTPMAMSPVDNKLYTARTKLYRTDNPRTSPVTWETLTPGFANGNSKATSLSLSPFDAGKIIVGNDAGDVRFTTNNGATWARATGLPSRFSTDLMYDPVNANRVYATVSGFRTGHVFVSNDNGATFTDISGNLPDVPVNAIEIDPTNNERVFVGTDIGVFVSLSAGTVWFPFNEGLPVVPVADMRIHRARRVLVAATHGRSVFDVSIDNITVDAVLLAPIGGETFTTPGKVTVRWAGLTGPANVLVSYREGEPFNLVAGNVAGSSAEIDLPMVRSSTARVRVEAVGGGQVLTSGNITLNVASNIERLGERGFIAEGIAMRDGQIWASGRDRDKIYRLSLPLLSLRDSVSRASISGRIRDIEHDPQADIFYVLVTADDFTGPVIHRMDTTGTSLGTVSLPPSITSASGIAVAPSGLAVATPGSDGRIVIIDVTSGAEVSASPYDDLRGDWRRGLVWNGTTFTQGVVRSEPGLEFPSEIQRLAVSDSARLYEALPVVVSSGHTLYFYDLTVDNTTSQTNAVYYATDTAGVFYRFRGELFSGIATGATQTRAASIAITSVTPNPLRGEATIDLSLESAEQLTLELVRADGARAALLFEGRLEQGAHEHRFNASLLPSGVYYLVATSSAGERVVRPVVVTK